MEALSIELNISAYSFELGNHHGKEIIWITFPYDNKLIANLRKHTKAKWSNSNKKWYVPDNSMYREMFRLEAKYIGTALLSHIHEINRPAFERYIQQLKLKAYSQNTIRTYCAEFAQLLKILKSHPVDELTPERVRAYILYCIDTLKLSENLIHSRINAIKFYFEQVLFRDRFFIEIPRPKKPSLLPKVLSAGDIKKMFATLENNIKHQLLLKLCYGMGLRVSEIVNLKITDIDSNRMQVLISHSKGKKDRYVVLPESILELLRAYYLQYRPKEYLFEGQRGGQYSVRSEQVVFKKAMQKAKINKRVGVHSLRHSYATHLVEQGTDIRFVQDLLGHSNIKTTMVYTHLTDSKKRKITSPLDNL